MTWEQRAKSALDDLETGRSRPVRIAVWGDAISGANEIVTGLLDDPLSADENQRNLLHQRWSELGVEGTIRIRRGDAVSRDGETLSIKSNWLQNLNAEIIECRDIDALPTLLASDHIILATDNIRLLSAPGLRNILQELSHAPSVNLLVTERAPGVPFSKDLGGLTPSVVKPELAVRGLESFLRGNTDQYQALLMASGLPQFSHHISDLCTAASVPSSPSSTAPLSVVRTAVHIARATLKACEGAINHAQTDLTKAAIPLEPFKVEVSAVYPSAVQTALRGTTTIREGVSAVEVRLRAAFARLPWYSLWWRADEVSATLSEAISWGSLGTQLAFHAGRLSSIRQQLYAKAVALAAPSPVLSNQLAQLEARTPVGPDALSLPLVQRTGQLLAPGGPVEVVHRRAQGVVIRTALNILGSGVVGTGLFVAGSIGAGTAVGVGLLGSVASIRWMQSVWGRAEKKWWADWARVCAGLERDCEHALESVVRDRVTGSAVAGIRGVESLIAQRSETIAALKQETSDLKQELTVLEQRLK
ncbi:hypothetical protein BDV93DRAFT_602826 [Ceratobasidium sp. AG-I]|nr:hypothetical protein BDV93DRAFT_602826 [Ceratobasidium sp. AG-I]